MLCTLGVATLALGSALPAVAQGECIPSAEPYLFVLFDVSGSMNAAPPCTAAEITAGSCSFLCNAPECYVPQQADNPSSKFFQAKKGLFDALSTTEAESVLFGFATFNQDTVRVQSKHWLYEAGADGVTIPGWGPFPALGSRDVLGRLWPCDEGSGDNEVGCLPSNPADLSDAWEVARVRDLAKGGATLTQVQTFYLRNAGIVYRIRYTPVAGGTLGSAVSLKVRIDRCNTTSCSSSTLLGEPTVPFTAVAEYLVWENGASRIEPIAYFGQTGAADASAANTCSGWDPNTDTTADLYSSYSLRWPTATGDPRGTYFHQGDVIPFDWLADHRQDIQERLAPNLVLDPLATPDFRISPFLRDTVVGGETFLRLQTEVSRPLIPVGSTPHGNTLRSFRTWYAGCASGLCPPSAGWVAQSAAQDPLSSCRLRNVVLITDGDENCAADPCSVASGLRTMYGVRTFVVALGGDLTPGSKLICTAVNGGTVEPYFARNATELTEALQEIFVAAGQP